MRPSFLFLRIAWTIQHSLMWYTSIFYSFFYKWGTTVVSLVVHEVESHHLCNHTCTGILMFVSFCYFSFPHPSHPLFPLYNPSFLHSCLPPTPIMYHHPLIREIIRPFIFWDWLISLSMIFFNFIHLPANDIILFSFMFE